jgi:hypothetical protein
VRCAGASCTVPGGSEQEEGEGSHRRGAIVTADDGRAQRKTGVAAA